MNNTVAGLTEAQKMIVLEKNYVQRPSQDAGKTLSVFIREHGLEDASAGTLAAYMFKYNIRWPFRRLRIETKVTCYAHDDIFVIGDSIPDEVYNASSTQIFDLDPDFELSEFYGVTIEDAEDTDCDYRILDDENRVLMDFDD